MSRHLTLLDPPVRTRIKRMQMVDAGCNPCGPGDIAQFECKRCGEQSEWLQCSASEIRRGIPCPKCNAVEANNSYPEKNQ